MKNLPLTEKYRPRTLAEALDNYKSGEMKAIIQAAADAAKGEI
jgi:hypothetical protein